MDIKALYTFVAIAEHGSFLAASRAVGLSPAAVSLHVKLLEEELRELLFDRSVRPPVLTERGRQTLEQARRVVSAWEQLGRQEVPEVMGVLELGAVPTVVASVVARGLAQLRAKHPKLKVRLATGYSDELEERVTRGTLDAAVMMAPPAPPLGLTFQPVVREPFLVVAPVGIEGRGDAALLQKLPYIRFRRQGSLARLIEAELERRHLRVEPAMEIDSLAGVLALVEAGLGVSILPEGQVQTSASAGVRAIPFGRPPLTRELGLLHRPEHPRAPQLRELVVALRESGVALASSGESQDGPVHQREGGSQPEQEGEVDAHDDGAERHLEKAGRRHDG
jgi:DNA-binding transcriptional LysR family regulator